MPNCSDCYFYNHCDVDELCDDIQYIDDTLFAEAEIERMRMDFMEDWFRYVEEND